MTPEEKREIMEIIKNKEVGLLEKGPAIRKMLDNFRSFGKYEITSALEVLWGACYEERIHLREGYRQDDATTATGYEKSNS